MHLGCALDGRTSATDCYFAMLRGIYNFIDQNSGMLPRVFLCYHTIPPLTAISYSTPKHPEIKKLLEKQKLFFVSYNLKHRTTVKGLSDLIVGESGDRMPTHLITTISEALKQNASLVAIDSGRLNISTLRDGIEEIQEDDRSTRSIESSILSRYYFFSSEICIFLKIFSFFTIKSLQTKRIRFSNLQLAIQFESELKMRNRVGR